MTKLKILLKLVNYLVVTSRGEQYIDLPIGARREGHTPTSCSERKYFGGEEPRHWTPCGAVQRVIDDHEAIDAICPHLNTKTSSLGKDAHDG